MSHSPRNYDIKKSVLTKQNKQTKIGQFFPNARLNPAPAWTNTTLDLFGSFVTRGEVNKRSRGKAYGLILTCAASRAVHVDLLVDY